MNARKRWSAVGVGMMLLSREASADLPPPPGTSRISYQFQIDAVPAGMTLVASPAYNTKKDGALYLILEPGKSESMFQGYTPGIYLLPRAEADALMVGAGPSKEVLASKAKLCLKVVPRVFAVPTETKIEGITDVLHVTVTPDGCSTSLVKTLYTGAKGAKGEGGVDATGKRLAPAPFGQDLPDVRSSGFALAGSATATAPTAIAPAPTAPTVSPAATGSAASAPPAASADARQAAPPSEPTRGGCAGCAVVPGASRWEAWLAGLLVAAGLGARRRRGEG